MNDSFCIHSGHFGSKNRVGTSVLIWKLLVVCWFFFPKLHATVCGVIPLWRSI